MRWDEYPFRYIVFILLHTCSRHWPINIFITRPSHSPHFSLFLQCFVIPISSFVSPEPSINRSRNTYNQRLNSCPTSCCKDLIKWVINLLTKSYKHHNTFQPQQNSRLYHDGVEWMCQILAQTQGESGMKGHWERWPIKRLLLQHL